MTIQFKTNLKKTMKNTNILTNFINVENIYD